MCTHTKLLLESVEVAHIQNWSVMFEKSHKPVQTTDAMTKISTCQLPLPNFHR